MSKHFGANRFVWNYFLNLKQTTYKITHKSLTYNQCSKAITNLKTNPQYSWLTEIDSQSLQQTLGDLDTAYSRFFKKISDFPKFKNKHHRQAFRVPQNIKITNNKLYFAKFRDGVKINIPPNIKLGIIKYITISKTPTNKYFVSITCDVGIIPTLQRSDKTIGLDLGIKNLIVCSNGTKITNIRSFVTNQKKLAFYQRQFSKKKKGSHSHKKIKHKVAQTHEKIAREFKY